MDTRFKNRLIKYSLLSIVFLYFLQPSVIAKEVPVIIKGFSGMENPNLIVSSGESENLTFKLYDDGLHGDSLRGDNIFGAIINLDRGIYNFSVNFIVNNESLSHSFLKNVYVDTYNSEIQLRTIVLNEEEYINEIRFSFLSKLGYAKDNVEVNMTFQTPFQVGNGKIYDLEHNFIDEWNTSKNYSFYLIMDPIIPSGRIFTGTFRNIKKSETGYFLNLKFPVNEIIPTSLDKISWRVYIPEKKHLIKKLGIRYEETFPDLVYTEGNHRVLQFNNPRKIKSGYYEYDILIHYNYGIPLDVIIIGFLSGLIGMFITLLFERLMSPKVDRFLSRFRKNK